MISLFIRLVVVLHSSELLVAHIIDNGLFSSDPDAHQRHGSEGEFLPESFAQIEQRHVP